MIEFENVSFSYTGQEHGGLHDINLKISDGECVLFCGRSGCGKTTITRLVNGLIPQFYQGELHGRVLVDGQVPFIWIAACSPPKLSITWWSRPCMACLPKRSILSLKSR